MHENAGLDAEEGRWLLVARREREHSRWGYGSFGEYVGRLCGYGARLVQEKLRVAEALKRLPVLASALEQGQPSGFAAQSATRARSRVGLRTRLAR